MAWNIVVTDEFSEWFTQLSADAKTEIMTKVELLKVLGPRLSRPHADTLKGSKHANMKELRGATKSQVLRVAFAFDPERSAILLVAGNKAGVGEKQFYKQLIDKAERLFDEHLKRIKKKLENGK